MKVKKPDKLYLLIALQGDGSEPGTIMLREGKDTGGWTIGEYAEQLAAEGIPFSFEYSAPRAPNHKVSSAA